jgi:hypothetical protein
MEQIVKYKLLKFGKGYVAPSEVRDGGEIWTHGNLGDTILVGKASISDPDSLPEGIIEVISTEQLDKHRAERKQSGLKEHKRRLYKEETDHLFIEALRDKLVHKNTVKWDLYVKKYKEIHDLEEIS